MLDILSGNRHPAHHVLEKFIMGWWYVFAHIPPKSVSGKNRFMHVSFIEPPINLFFGNGYISYVRHQSGSNILSTTRLNSCILSVLNTWRYSPFRVSVDLTVLTFSDIRHFLFLLNFVNFNPELVFQIVGQLLLILFGTSHHLSGGCPPVHFTIKISVVSAAFSIPWEFSEPIQLWDFESISISAAGSESHRSMLPVWGLLLYLF